MCGSRITDGEATTSDFVRHLKLHKEQWVEVKWVHADYINDAENFDAPVRLASDTKLVFEAT